MDTKLNSVTCNLRSKSIKQIIHTSLYLFMVVCCCLKVWSSRDRCIIYLDNLLRGKEHPRQVSTNLAHWFQRRCYLNEKLTTDARQRLITKAYTYNYL